jgi:hypothetical protein
MSVPTGPRDQLKPSGQIVIDISRREPFISPLASTFFSFNNEKERCRILYCRPFTCMGLHPKGMQLTATALNQIALLCAFDVTVICKLIAVRTVFVEMG